MAALYQLGSLQGSMRLQAPILAPGYDSSRAATPMLSVHVSLRPPLLKPPAPLPEVASGEQASLAQHAAR